MIENIKRLFVGMSMAAGLMVLGVLGASAASASDASDAVDAEFTSLQGDITSVYLPALLALIVLGVGVALGVKWLRKGASKA